MRPLRDRLLDYYTPGQLRAWLKNPQRLLAGAVPRDLIAEGREAEIHRLLDVLDAGAYL